MLKVKIPTGTKEWADSNVNICFGCKNNCRYCYAKKMAIRFGRKTENNWKNMELNYGVLNKRFLKRPGRVMFPSSHDITLEILDSCIIVLNNMLISGNTVLITSKPEFECIKSLCSNFTQYKQNIQFRFTIGSNLNHILKFWEPGAPLFEERLKSLRWAFHKGYKTSVSIEPFLDYDPLPLFKQVEPFVTESIWIGVMNYIPRSGLNLEDVPYFEEIRKNYTIDNIIQMYYRLKDHPKIRWKDSIKKILLIQKLV